ncbi:MAG TPA: hypothetical protein VFR67_00425 [Pilimelia sp.]|nr:hypothetical protein [Pilimelia sp.]
MVSRRAALLYAAAAAAGVAACERSPQPPVRPDFSEAPSTGNVRVSRDGLAWHAEPHLAVNPRDPGNLLGACIAGGDSGSVIAAYASFDGGATWRSLGALPDSSNGRDPTVSFDAAGRGYVCANTDDLHVWRTDDGGGGFAAPVLATEGHKLDHPWLAADPTPGPPSATHLYAAWTGPDNTQLEFARSADAGRSFQDPRAIDAVAGPDEANFASPMLAAGADGTVHIVYGVWPPLPKQPLRPEFPAPIRVISSTDRGLTWTRPAQLGIASMEVQVAPDTNVPGLPSIVAHRQRPFAAAAFIVRPPGAPFTDIAVCLSRDRGRTWTPPAAVPRVSDDTIYTQPQLAVDETGRLALSAFAHRQGLVDVVVLVADPGTSRFRPPVVITSQPFNPARGGEAGKHGAWWIGDYQGLASAAGTIHPFWNDTRTGRLEIFTERY